MFDASSTQQLQLPTVNIPILNSAPRQYPDDPDAPSQEEMRRVGWEVGEKNLSAKFVPEASHVALHWVAPKHGFAHWRIKPEWIEKTAKEKGGAWTNCRMVLRLYDVTCIIFNGLNAHQITNIALPQICGQTFFHLPRAGTTHIAEVGFELRNGEFVAAARSHATPLPPDAPSGRGSNAGLLVEGTLKPEPIENIWEQEHILTERRKPKLRKPLRIATLAFEAAAVGQSGTLATFVSELAKEQHAAGHNVHVFTPKQAKFKSDREVDGVVYHPIDIDLNTSPVRLATRFAQAVEKRLATLPPFDLIHVHEWIAGMAPWITRRPAVLSLSSIELIRRNGADATPLSLEIERTEREIAQGFGVVLTPHYARDRAVESLKMAPERVIAFPMEGRLPNEWESPLDVGKVKQELGFGPLDRLLLFVGPLEHVAGPDLIVEGLPGVLQRTRNLRVAFIGSGSMYNGLYNRANQLGVGHAVRIFPHVDGELFKRALRASMAIMLPARQRYAGDEDPVRWARFAGRAVIATHGGIGFLVKHEQTGVVTYDNPGSIVWAIDRILADASHTERMGAAGRQQTQGNSCQWSDVARRYLGLCAETFPELT